MQEKEAGETSQPIVLSSANEVVATKELNIAKLVPDHGQSPKKTNTNVN